jgi:hypothetical protein
LVTLIRRLIGSREHRQKVAPRIRNEAEAAVLRDRVQRFLCLVRAGRVERLHATGHEEVDHGVRERGGDRSSAFNPLKEPIAKPRPFDRRG